VGVATIVAMGQTIGTDHHRRGAPAHSLASESARSGARRLASIALVVLLTTLIGAVILTVWTQPGPDVLSADARAGVRAECAGRVASGLSPDMTSCTSWATEIRVDAQRALRPASPAILALAAATGLLAGMVVDLASRPTADGRRARRRRPAYRGSTG
jgi:hypothetical protein